MKNHFFIIFFVLFSLLSCVSYKSLNKNIIVTTVCQTDAMLGEGAVWDYKAEKLFWVDIEKGKLHIYDPNIEKDTTIDVGQRIGTVVPESNNTVIVALQNGVYRLNLKDEGLDFLVNPEKGDKNNRLNDGKCDPAGRFWVGSMS